MDINFVEENKTSITFRHYFHTSRLRGRFLHFRHKRKWTERSRVDLKKPEPYIVRIVYTKISIKTDLTLNNSTVGAELRNVEKAYEQSMVRFAHTIPTPFRQPQLPDPHVPTAVTILSAVGCSSALQRLSPAKADKRLFGSFTGYRTVFSHCCFTV